MLASNAHGGARAPTGRGQKFLADSGMLRALVPLLRSSTTAAAAAAAGAINALVDDTTAPQAGSRAPRESAAVAAANRAAVASLGGIELLVGALNAAPVAACAALLKVVEASGGRARACVRVCACMRACRSMCLCP